MRQKRPRKAPPEAPLAIEGGQPATGNLGPYPSKLGSEELLALVDLWKIEPGAKREVRRLLRRGVQGGPYLFRYYGPTESAVARAERLFAERMRVRHALAVNSGTSALIASLRALGIGAGDEVIVPAYTFFATAAAVATCNAVPVICEVDDSLCLSPEAFERAITPRTRAVIPVHMRGAPADMDAILKVARRNDIAVVEDVAQACGGSWRGRPLGSLGALGCFSLGYAKLVVCGEGGMVTTNDDRLFMRAQGWHDTAACWRPDRYAPERTPGELFCGENYRMSELQGAVLSAQLRKLDGILRRLRRAKSLIRNAIAPRPGLEFRRLNDPAGEVGNVLVMFMPDAAVRKRVVAAFRAEGVPAASPYSPEVRDWHVYCHWDHILSQKAVARDGLPWSAAGGRKGARYSREMCPRTLALLERSVSVAISPHFTAAHCRAVAAGINKVFRRFLT